MYELELIDKPHDGPGPIYHDTPIPPRKGEPTMYRVEWNDFEGNLQQMDFEKARDAYDEAKALKIKFDYVVWGEVEHLYSVGMVDRETNEKVNLKVWATNTDNATHKITNALFGAYGPYRWTGSGPIYRNNELVTRIRPHSDFD